MTYRSVPIRLFFLVLCTVGLSFSSVQGQTDKEQEQSLHQAIASASKFGYPVLVIVSQESCKPCMALKRELQSSLEIRQLLEGCLKIYIDCDAPEYRQWTQLHTPADSSLPQMFLVRSDGKLLINRSGTFAPAQIKTALEAALRGAGKPITQSESENIRQFLEKLIVMSEQGQFFDAADMVARNKPMLQLAMNCYASPAMELKIHLRKLNAKLAAQVELTRTALQELKSLPRSQQTSAAEQIHKSLHRLSHYRPIATQWKKVQQEALNEPVYRGWLESQIALQERNSTSQRTSSSGN